MEFIRFFLTIIIYSLFLNYGFAFIAYDCSSSNLNITSFSTLDVQPCSIPVLSDPIQIPFGKLIQRKESIMVSFRSCYVKIRYSVTRCSMFGDAQMVKDGIFTVLETQGPDLCNTIHKQQAYGINTPYHYDRLPLNRTTEYTRVVVGSLKPEGKCEGGSFYYGSHSWTDVTVVAEISIHLATGYMPGSTKDNLVIHPSGTRFNLKDGYGIQQHEGEIVWDSHPIIECESGEFDVLYVGPMSVLRYKNPHAAFYERDIYIVKNTDTLFALRIEKQTTVCGYPANQTEHPRLFIITDESSASRFPNNGLDPVNMDMTAYINNKLMFLDVNTRTNTEKLYRTLLAQQCELERDNLKYRLGLAHKDLEEFAFRMGEGPGFTAITGGEVVYLIKCAPVEVELRTSNDCILENCNNK